MLLCPVVLNLSRLLSLKPFRVGASLVSGQTPLSFLRREPSVPERRLAPRRWNSQRSRGLAASMSETAMLFSGRVSMLPEVSSQEFPPQPKADPSSGGDETLERRDKGCHSTDCRAGEGGYKE